MPRLTPLSWKILDCIYTKAGFKMVRQKGDHRIYTKKDVIRPLVLPTYPEVDVMIIQSNMRSAGMTRKLHFELLKACK